MNKECFLFKSDNYLSVYSYFIGGEYAKRTKFKSLRFLIDSIVLEN